MSGTFQLGGALFPRDPLTKRWQADRVGTQGTRAPIFADIWRLELGFGTLQVSGEHDFFETRFLAGGLYTAILPHPITGLLVGFTGVSIDSYEAEFNDVEHNAWAESARMVLGVDVRATGTV